MTILVTSSGDVDSPDFQQEFPGTAESDIFIISKKSHGYPDIDTSEEMQGGSDTYYLNLDTDPDSKKPHPWGLGGGSPNINGYNFEKDRIFLPKGVALDDIIIIRAIESNKGMARIRYDPYGTYKKLFPANDSYFDMTWKEGNVYISGAVTYDPQGNPEGHPIAIRAIKSQEADPKGYELHMKEVNKRAQSLDQDTYLYGADDLGTFEFSSKSSGKISDFMRTIFDHDKNSLYEYAYSDSDNVTPEDNAENPDADQSVNKPQRYKIRFVDKITNFNPSIDTLEIDTDSFGIDSSATFAAGKNKKAVKKKLANQDFDFLYDQKKGGLYFNENGSDKGFGDGGIIAILKGAPDLTSSNLEFV